ncbi:Mitochondrial substrate carrier family protein S [Diplonema papillatum]|nr:Mitochondrial substrate carrier family protein S [Diplonema papillatum]
MTHFSHAMCSEWERGGERHFALSHSAKAHLRQLFNAAKEERRIARELLAEHDSPELHADGATKPGEHHAGDEAGTSKNERGTVNVEPEGKGAPQTAPREAEEPDSGTAGRRQSSDDGAKAAWDEVERNTLRFDEFAALLAVAKLPAAELGEEEQRALYRKVAKRGDAPGDDEHTVSFNEFVDWVTLADDENAAMLEETSDASLWAAVARSLTSMTRPLAQNMAAVFNVLMQRGTLAVAKYIANPARLFRRVAVGTLEVIGRRNTSLTVVSAVRAELQTSGVYGVASLAFGPWLFNSVVSFAMFETYTRLKEAITTESRPWTRHFQSDDPYMSIIKCDTFSGASAGLVQAVINTPAYNIKRGMPGKSLTQGGLDLYVKKGLRGVFADMQLIMLQETLGLACFFTSYELYKLWLQQRVDEEHKVATWVCAGMAAGMTLTAVTHPFDNLHEWHVAHRSSRTPHNAFVHFCTHPHSNTVRRTLFHGLSRRMVMGVPAGIPLLIYELLSDNASVQAHLDAAKAAESKPPQL